VRQTYCERRCFHLNLNHYQLTQATLARKAGIDKTYLSQLETGRKQGSVAALARLASALSVEVDDLIDFGALDLILLQGTPSVAFRTAERHGGRSLQVQNGMKWGTRIP